MRHHHSTVTLLTHRSPPLTTVRRRHRPRSLPLPTQGKGADLTPPKFLRLLPIIAQRPVMARWNRLAESIYKVFKKL